MHMYFILLSTSHLCPVSPSFIFFFFLFFFNDTATTEIYTLSLHDALPIFDQSGPRRPRDVHEHARRGDDERRDRKSTRLNSSHVEISYAVFCLKKKKKKKKRKTVVFTLIRWRHIACNFKVRTCLVMRTIMQ